MRKRVVLAIFFFLLSGLSFLGFRFFQTRQLESSALQITTTPKSQVYLDNQLLGSTPLFNDKLKPGEHTVKIVPERTTPPTFEQKVKFSPLLLTAIDRTFRETEAQSEGSILTLESISDKNRGEVLVISNPSEAKVYLDNELKGVSPLEIKNVTASDHELELNASGFLDKKVRIKTSAGYKLTANIKLALSLEEDKVASPSPTPTPTLTLPTLRIKQTPTGFLRVRFSPSLSATEVARVKPGETFPILEEATSSGWTKISLPDGTSGWVSNLYVTRF